MLIFCKKEVGISKIKRTLVLKGIFSETKTCVYLHTKHTKFEVSGIIQQDLDRGTGEGGNYTNPSPQDKPLRSSPRLG